VFWLFRGHPAIWIGRRKQREILKLSGRHLSKIIELTKNFHAFVEAFSTNNLNDLKRCFEEIFRLEREADDEKEKIISEVSRGPFHPMDREDLLRLVMTMDDIAANVKAASRKLLYLDPNEIPENVKVDLIKLSDLVLDIVLKLEEALTALIDGSEDVLKKADMVERKEEEIDEFRSEFIMKVLRWGDEMRKISSLLMLKEAIENLENSSDKAEDVADVIRGIFAISPR